MAIQFDLERLHQYVFGQSLVVQSDQKPLLGIINKPIAEVSPRLQRLRLRCLRYQFVLAHKPGRELIIAVNNCTQTISGWTRSRSLLNFIRHCQPSEMDSSEQIAAVLHQTLPAFEQREVCRQATSSDATLQALLPYTFTDWPDRRKQLPAPLRPYWGVRYDLTTHRFDF